MTTRSMPAVKNKSPAPSAVDLIPGGILGATKWPPPFDFTIAHGSGARMWTTTGKVLIDYLLGSGPMVLGHAHPQITEAVRQQVARGTQFYAMNERALALAERIIDLVPCAESVKFLPDGSSPTFSA